MVIRGSEGHALSAGSYGFANSLRELFEGSEGKKG